MASESKDDERRFKEGDPNVVMIPLENFVYLDKSILDQLYEERLPVQKLTEDDFFSLPKPVFPVSDPKQKNQEPSKPEPIPEEDKKPEEENI
jgi:hypothetical protein